MTRRDVLLREMGLGPVWKLRGSEEAVADSPPEASIAVEAPRSSRMAAVPQAAAAPQTTANSAEREQLIRGLDWEPLEAMVKDCTACGLCKTRRQTVFGVGDAKAEWMLVGEAPGAEEDARGEPFVGQAGKLLDAMLASLGLARGNNVYIANVLKCRPPGNRNPEPGEVAQCSPYLVRQLELIQPRLILALGRFAAQALLGTEASIASLRGRVHRYQGVPVVVSYHPAYLLRNLPDKAKAWQDLVFARRTLGELREGKG